MNANYWRWKKSCTSWFGKYPCYLQGFSTIQTVVGNGISEPSTVLRTWNRRIFTWHFPNSLIFSYSLSCDSTADSGTDCQKEATSKSIFSHESHVVIGDWEAVFNAADTPRNNRKVTKPGHPPLLQNFMYKSRRKSTNKSNTSKKSARIKKWIYMKKSPPTRCFGPVCHFFRDFLVRKSPWVEATAGTCLLIVPLWNGGGPCLYKMVIFPTHFIKE